MRIEILTLFPDMFKGPFEESIISRAVKEGHAIVNVHNLRDWGLDSRKTVDDVPYGGGPGMVMRVDVIDKALTYVLRELSGNSAVILTSASGKKYNQKDAESLKSFDNLVIICGHYEGIDDRVRQHLVTHCFSIGDYVLTGGELPAAVILDSVVRLLPGVLGNSESLEEESNNELLEYPQFTRPQEYKGWDVPEVLLSGNHKEIKKWRKQKSIEITIVARAQV